MNTKKDKVIFFFIVVLLLAGLILTYSNHFHNPFHFDDSHTIVNNSYIRDIRNIPFFFKTAETASSLPANQAYRPLVTTSLAIDYWIAGGLEPFYFHLSMFIFFIFQCFLLYFIFLRIIDSAQTHAWNSYIALFITCFYAFHTSNAETLNYIISRTDLLSTFLIVCGMAMYILSDHSRKYKLYILPVVAGIFAKETVAMFPLLLLLYILLFEHDLSIHEWFQKKNFHKVSHAIKTFLPSFLICLVMIIFVLKMIPEKWNPGATPRINYLATQFFVIAHYLFTFFLPLQLSADTDWKAFDNIYDDRVVAGLLIILLIIFIAYRASFKKETRPITFGILWFFISLAPTSSLMPLSEVMNDHRIFFPFIGLALSAGWAIGLLVLKCEEKIRKNLFYKIFVPLIALLIIFSHAYGVYQRNIVWHDAETLWKDVSIKSPNNGRGLMNYGLALMSKGNYNEALHYYQRALVLLPRYSYLQVNMGILKSAMKYPVAEVEEHFRNALNFDPNNPQPLYFYADWLNKQNREEEAILQLKKALALSPGHSHSNELLKEIRMKSLPAEEKIKIALDELEKKPTATGYLNLSLLYYNLGKYEQCVDACKDAIKLKPDYAAAYNNICSAYNVLKNWNEAIKACEKAIQIDPNFQLAKNNLAEAKKNLKKQ